MLGSPVGRGRNEPLSVRVLRAREDRLDVRLFDHLAAVHHRDTVAVLGDDAQVMRDAWPGTAIQIDRSPFEIPEDFLGRTDDLSARAAAAIEKLN